MRWNRGAERLTGYSAARTVGKPFMKQPCKHVSPSGREIPEVQQPLLQTRNDGIPREALAYINHADGYRITIFTRCFPIYRGHEHPAGAIELFTDNKALIAAFHVAQTTEETILFDPLTGIGNRSHIESKIRTAIEGYKLGKTSFGVLFIDIDYFKMFNDSKGHLSGDKLLRLVANTIRSNLRVTDSCGRWGGEEFISLVYSLDLRGLGKVAEKLRAAIEAARIREDDVEAGVTVSIGSTLVRPSDTLHSVIDRADRLMYKSKRAGRNRVSLA
jgi:diguanylate cyclase (GGDEF)-like protein